MFGHKKFFYKYTIFRIFEYLENNCLHEKFSKLRKLGFRLFFTEIVAKKLFKYFLTYKSKEINAKSFFPNLAPFEIFFFRGFRFFEVCYKIWRLNQNGWIIDSEVTEFWKPRAASREIRAHRNTEDYETSQKFLKSRFADCKFVPGTHKLHYIQPTKESFLNIKTYSSFEETDSVCFSKEKSRKK